MEVKEFFDKLKQHCTHMDKTYFQAPFYYEACVRCCYREFCFTPPVSLSDGLLDQALKNLEKVQLEEHETNNKEAAEDDA